MIIPNLWGFDGGLGRLTIGNPFTLHLSARWLVLPRLFEVRLRHSSSISWRFHVLRRLGGKGRPRWKRASNDSECGYEGDLIGISRAMFGCLAHKIADRPVA